MISSSEVECGIVLWVSIRCFLQVAASEDDRCRDRFLCFTLIWGFEVLRFWGLRSRSCLLNAYSLADQGRRLLRPLTLLFEIRRRRRRRGCRRRRRWTPSSPRRRSGKGRGSQTSEWKLVKLRIRWRRRRRVWSGFHAFLVCRYNFDVEKETPLEGGRYEWILLKWIRGQKLSCEFSMCI